LQLLCCFKRTVAEGLDKQCGYYNVVFSVSIAVPFMGRAGGVEYVGFSQIVKDCTLILG